MNMKTEADYKTLTYPLSDGRCFVVGFFGDVADGEAMNGWSVIDISIENPDGSSETLCSVVYQQNRK